ncbi:MAG TPA: hypothetical protein VL403_18020, partial [Candidatus Kryptonia bacterium]|nr:hypothetical protein [Candidatus Kryptonia bacterium]
MLEKLTRLVVGGQAGVVHDATAALQECFVACTQRVQQLGRHAEMAPQEYAAAGLHALAAAEEKQAERLRDALRAAGVAPVAPASESPTMGALNHWARLVHDLEAHRVSARRLRELAVHFAESLPNTAALFDELCRE